MRVPTVSRVLDLLAWVIVGVLALSVVLMFGVFLVVTLRQDPAELVAVAAYAYVLWWAVNRVTRRKA